MAKFGKSSVRRLDTCAQPLQALMRRVVIQRDCSITCGERGQEDQDAAFNARPQLSKVKYPGSKHNSSPSMAVDVVPWPEKWGSTPAFKELAKIVQEEWAYMSDEEKDGYTLRWGGDWDGDGDTDDQTFVDMPHWELIRK